MVFKWYIDAQSCKTTEIPDFTYPKVENENCAGGYIQQLEDDESNHKHHPEIMRVLK